MLQVWCRETWLLVKTSCSVFSSVTLLVAGRYSTFSGDKQGSCGVLKVLKSQFVPDLPGQSRFLTTCHGKNQFYRGTHLPLFWLGVPDLYRFAQLCSRMLAHRWPKISSDIVCIYEKIAGCRGSARYPAGGAHDAPPDAQVGPLMARTCGACTLQFTPSALVPDCGAQIMVTLVQMSVDMINCNRKGMQ